MRDLYVPFKCRNCYMRPTAGRQSVHHIKSTTKPSVEFSWISVWQFFMKISGARLRFVKTVPVSHTIYHTVIHSVVFYTSNQQSNWYISRSEPLEVGRQICRTANIQCAEGRSRNRCFSGISICNKCFVGVFLCLCLCVCSHISFPTCNAHAPYYIAICVLSVSKLFFIFISKRRDFRKITG